jgi:hypothetical protein
MISQIDTYHSQLIQSEFVNFSPTEIEKIILKISLGREALPAIMANDRVNTLALFNYLVGEVHEAWERAEQLIAELDEQDSDSSQEKIKFLIKEQAKELIDVLVFVVSIFEMKNIPHPVMDIAYSPVSLNGAGQDYDFYQETVTVAEMINDGNIESNLIHLFSLVLSRLKHLPGDFDLNELTDEVLSKNRNNRPEIYYSDIGIDGRQLTLEEQGQRYLHNEIALRMLRKHFNRINGEVVSDLPLEPWMHNLFRGQILNFERGEEGIKIIEAALIQIDEAICWHIITMMRDDVQSEAPVILNSILSNGGMKERTIKRGFQLAGGVDLDHNNQKVV